MKKILAALLLVLLSVSVVRLTLSIPANSKARIHASLRNIHIFSPAGEGQCSAYTVGPHTILTAGHCFMYDPKLAATTIGFGDNIAPSQVEITYDHHDHALLRFSDRTFPVWVKMVFTAPKWQGERVVMWGNPSAIFNATDCYREGYYSGASLVKDNRGTLRLVYIFVLPMEHGDSGSLVFDNSGRIISMASMMDSGFMMAEGFFFTPAQIAHARE
jgi:hypothetical protein